MKPQHNLSKSKEETARLAEENRIMEVRLRELKLAMDKEKQARSAEGRRWESAREDRTSAGVNHPPDVLKKNMRQVEKPKVPRVRKVKVLKDEPIVLPPHPPTVSEDIKRIMKKDVSKSAEAKDTSPKQKKCGQCEMKAAAVLCQDCGENYCPGCFASFHMKGALKKHRSVPLQALGIRQSPRLPFMPKPPPVSYHETEPIKPVPAREEEPKPIEHKKNFEGPSLLDGEYDEEANAAEFQAALAAWRSGKTGAGEPENNEPQQTTIAPRDRSRDQPKSATSQSTQSPRYTIDVKGTSTDDKAKPLKIEFHTSELSYAEKLLLRKHRRDPVDALPITSPTSSHNEAVTPRLRDLDVPRNSTEDEPQHEVDFQSLYEVSCSSQRTSISDTYTAHLPNTVQVVEVTSALDCTDMEQVNSYQVEEEPGSIEYVNQNNQRNAKKEKPSKNTKQADPKSSRSRTPANDAKTSRSKTPATDDTKSVSKSNERPQSSRQNSASKTRKSSDLAKSTEKPPKPPSDTMKRPPRPKRNSTDKPTDSVEDNNNKTEVTSKNNNENVSLILKDLKEKRAWSRAQASPRPKSRSAATPRTGRPSTPKSARPSSRQAFRESLGEGILTKKPSSALSEIAKRTASDSHVYRGLGDILTLGVQLPQTDRIIIPRSQAPQSARSEKKQAVSYKLYAMGPKSWRPDSSLGQAVPDSDLTTFDYNLTLADPTTEVDDDVTQEIKALDVIGRLGLNFNSTETHLNQSESRIPQSQPEVLRIDQSETSRIDQSETLKIDLSERLNESYQSNCSSPDPALERLRESSDSTDEEKKTADMGRLSRMIIPDGDDMTRYDDQFDDPVHTSVTIEGVTSKSHIAKQDDDNTLDQLEWELASMTGRITADGKISRLSLHSSQDSAVSSPGTSPGSSQNMDSAREIDLALRNDGLGFDELESQITDELEVRALQ